MKNRIMNFLDRTLDNGIRVVCCSAPLETVSVSVGIGYGSIDETPETNGSAHFLEHMLFRGTARRTWKQLNEQIMRTVRPDARGRKRIL